MNNNIQKVAYHRLTISDTMSSQPTLAWRIMSSNIVFRSCFGAAAGRENIAAGAANEKQRLLSFSRSMFISKLTRG